METVVAPRITPHVGSVSHVAFYTRVTLTIYTVMTMSSGVDDDRTTNSSVRSAGMTGHTEGVICYWQFGSRHRLHL